MKRLTQTLLPLKGHNSFKRVLSNGIKVRTDNFLGVFVQSSIASEIVLFGISIPKRCAKKAVVRNRTKRLIRESLLAIAHSDKEMLLAYEEFVLIRLEKLPSHPKLIRLSNVKSEICELFAKAKVRLGKDNEALTDRND